MGLARQHLNRHLQAADAYRRAVKLQPDHVDALVNLALSQKEIAQPDAAMKNVEAALAADPNHARALNLCGTLHAEHAKHIKKDGDPQAAQAAAQTVAMAYFQRALTAAPDNIDARHNLANSQLQAGDPEAALETARPLFAPPVAKRHKLLHGQILLDLKRYGDAFTVVDDLTAQFTDDVEVMLLQMALYELVKDHFAVIEVARKLLDKTPPNEYNRARIWNSLGGAYFQLDGIAAAAECYDKAVKLQPDHAEYQNNRGLAHAARGEKTAAEKYYRRALELNSRYAEAWRNLVAMKKFTALDDPDAAAILKLWQDDLDDFTRTKLAFALGKVYDDLGDHPQAFEVYDIGNRLKFTESKLDFDRYFSHIDQVPKTFTALPKNESGEKIDHTPIFILGMPRSGTTLVEQIITRHPQVTGCGELPCIEKAIARLEKRAEPMRTYPHDFLAIDGETLSGETRHYLAWVQRLHKLQTPFFTDKMPFNFVHLWFIKALFPAAAVIHCHRHPLDVITSNYFQLYASDVSFVYDLKILAGYYVRYHRLMRHWRDLFAAHMHTVQYEILVSDKEAQIRKLIQAANLPWHDACLDPKKSAAAVRTASIWQVREGIYTTSKARWRNYQTQLAPAIEILQAEGILDDELNEKTTRG